MKSHRHFIHVVYGLVGLKTHTKIVLVVRQEGEKICRYVHIGTGNYNPKTAKLYTDLGLLSCREELGADLTDLFNYLTGYSCQNYYRKLLVSPVTMRDRMLREIFYGEENKELVSNQKLIDAEPREIFIIACLLVPIIGIGLYPKILTQVYDATTVQLTERLRDAVPSLAQQITPEVSLSAPEIE